MAAMYGQNAGMKNNVNANVSRQDKTVAIWLLTCCALVFVMVVLGGVTRLTGSGLSMTDWKPVTGILPPIGDAAWQQEFSRYQRSPEYRDVNSRMDVNAFKGIFWLEYLHRLLGRIIGLAFLLPFVYFVARGYIRRSETLKYAAMFVLGGMQGLLGWYMVKSGLVDDPHVSQYRLTAHLTAAFAIYAYMLWVALSLLYPARAEVHSWFSRALALSGLITVTILSGGFVAGLKAGKIYNSFPLMGDSLIPPGLFALSPAWLNFFENTTTVQFDHRLLALTTFALVVLFWWRSRHADLPARAARAANAMLHVASLQVVLGISTLLLAVPIWLGAAHQATALLLFSSALVLLHGLRRA